MKLANKFDVPVTVRSAGTSLADGAIPVYGGIVLLMERLNKVLELNTEGMYLVTEAGVPRYTKLNLSARRAKLLKLARV